MPGKLYVVGTPIGNLGDFSPRAVETLSSVDFIAAEDTRVTVKLLNRFEIKNKLISYHEHNRAEKGEAIIDMILSGKSCALVSDAGMPVISDPGQELVKLCRENGMTVVLITHHMDECVGADRLIVMSNGHIVADGTPKDVFADVALMDREGLSVPATVRLVHELRDAGWALPEDELDVEDCADELSDFIKRKENG